jgi:hypothetical protein
MLDALDELIDFPKSAHIVVGWFDSLDVDELIDLVFLPEGASESSRADKEASMQAQHPGDVFEVSLDSLAGRSALVESATQLYDKAGTLPEF